MFSLCQSSNSWTFYSEGSGFAYKCLHFLGDCSSGNREFTDVHFASCKYQSFNSSVPKPTFFFSLQQNQQVVSWLIKLEPTTITILFSSVVVFKNEKIWEVQRHLLTVARHHKSWWLYKFLFVMKTWILSWPKKLIRGLSAIPSD